MTRIAVTGATGEMGSEVIAEANERPEMTVAVAVNRDPSVETVAGVPVHPAADLEHLLSAESVDVVVDFTGPASSVSYVSMAVDADVAAVVGTTGFDDAQLDSLRDAGSTIPIIVAPNFSRGVYALEQALREVVTRLPAYDIELTETHHNRKRDAPSGTADRLLGIVEELRETSERTHGREGESPRTPGDIGVHARRAGTITGEHEVLLAGDDEELRLVHRAESRRVFAAGALDAAAWLDGKPAGWYRFGETLSDT